MDIKPDENLQHIVGKKINRDIFNPSGVLLVAESSIINQKHVRLLQKYDIALTSQDVTSIGPYCDPEAFIHYQIIEDTVQQVEYLFSEVRVSREIPLSQLRKEVIPTIHEAADGSHLLGLFASLQAKDDYTYRHNIAVSVISNLLGTWMGLDHQEILQLTTAALLHDVGKMLIPLEILNKPGKLNEQEYEVMKNHTVLGYELIKETVGANHRQAIVALQHHERMDGSGYPLGIDKDKLDLFSRIVSVADVFHAMTSMRVYRDPSPFNEVLFQMEKDTFGALDPVITRIFIEKIMNSLIGRSVLLTDGSEGTVLMIQSHDLTHPFIQSGSKFLDLSKDYAVQIKQIL
ncbi:HD-GYP domain-containing protein [Cohnella endophytica]|uniref:HD-GYP domain-containing protein n=1 Tax=Cohnella endophytica TaxID=2419778 RepID=A0A494X7N5_9BACL|nr:HD-GYP domain-containing protein [Cohnella endophytica]RKP46292.1 HD-GYP domain-containing protein [Cohnella endophytica]